MNHDCWQSPLYIISGEQGEGKTSFLIDILEKLAESGARIRGIAAPGYFKDGLRSGFSILNLETGISEELCSVTPSEGSEKHGRYFFKPEGLFFGYKALLNPITPGKADLLVIDEVGRFELEGAVWSNSINQILKMPYPPMIWTVRESLVDVVTKKWPVTRTIVRRVASINHEEFISDLKDEIMYYRSYISQNLI